MKVEEEMIGGGVDSSSRISSTFVPSVSATKDRQRFTVELRPGETTFVSWRKLIKNVAKKSNQPSPPPAVELPSFVAHSALESQISTVRGQPAEGELEDAPPSSRFSAVIEKIEHLYMGKQSSGEEELDDGPDDNQYDTEDSFIDDADLDEYFQVDKSRTKHEGFFVNRGKLEHVNESVSLQNHQQKKRRKDLTKDLGEKNGELAPNKYSKMGNMRVKASSRSSSSRTPSMHVKEGSSVRPKGTMLERAIRELENIVAESRPQILEVQDADTSSQAVKRRLPREVKLKLAKVARLAQSSQGKISDELIKHLMSILGHIVQLKTLKRNLKEMVELGLSAKQEKDDRFQQIKKEVVEMIRTRSPLLKSEVAEQLGGASNDFQEVLGLDETQVSEGRHSMDDAVEDKICDLYDLYVEGMDEDKGPQIRKLYVELAELWPNGSMDNHGIKSAVCRAKERKRTLYNRKKDQEKIKRKKLSSTPRTEDIVRGEANSTAHPRFMSERMVTENSQVLTSPNRTTSSLTVVNHPLVSLGRMSKSSTSCLDRPKQEKVKGNSSTFLEEARKAMDGTLLKKKAKRKSETDFGDIHFYSEKSFQQGKERNKAPKAGLESSPQ